MPLLTKTNEIANEIKPNTYRSRFLLNLVLMRLKTVSILAKKNEKGETKREVKSNA